MPGDPEKLQAWPTKQYVLGGASQHHASCAVRGRTASARAATPTQHCQYAICVACDADHLICVGCLTANKTWEKSNALHGQIVVR